MNASLDGEIVTKLKPVFGYLHRNHEKIGENASYLGSMPYTDRLDYFCSMTNNWAYALSVEKLAGIEVPERAEYLRVILAELTRLQNHASLLGFLLSDMGAWGHAAHVRIPRTRKDSRSVRIALRLAHDVRLHALRRLPGGCGPGLDGAREEDCRCFPEVSRRVRAADPFRTKS